MKTVKIAGVSGAGKSTLMRLVEERARHVRSHTYSSYLKQYGKLADAFAWRDLVAHKGVSLMDEHLEFGEADLSHAYIREETIGIVVLEVSPEVLLARRRRDLTRPRPDSKEHIITEQRISIQRAVRLAEICRLPLVHLRDSDIERAASAVDALLQRAG